MNLIHIKCGARVRNRLCTACRKEAPPREVISEENYAWIRSSVRPMRGRP